MRLLVTFAVIILAASFSPALANSTIIITSGTSFTTSTVVPHYRVIVIGASGGGGSSSGAGTGGSGATGNITDCDIQGDGQTYTYQIGVGGAAGAAGLSGSAGTASFWADATNCAANGGNGGTNGTGSDGAGGTAASANTCAAMLSSNMMVGTCIVTRQGLAGASGSSFVPQIYGQAAGGGCASANCTSNTAGANGKIILIPESDSTTTM